MEQDATRASSQAEVMRIQAVYDQAVKKVEELRRRQRQVVTDAVKRLEERKLEEIRKRLMAS